MLSKPSRLQPRTQINVWVNIQILVMYLELDGVFKQLWIWCKNEKSDLKWQRLSPEHFKRRRGSTRYIVTNDALLRLR